MGETTGISWTDHTWNTAVGCRKVDPLCKNCYAETLVENRMRRDFSVVTRTAPATFNAPLKWAKESPGTKVFANSISDFFIEEQDAWRAEAWDIIKRTPELTYQILTKRAERIKENLPTISTGEGTNYYDPSWPWPNVWLGASAGTQLGVDKRVPELLAVPAKVHFLSCEPLLGELDISSFLRTDTPGSRWLIAGGESGPDRRDMDLAWLTSLVDQCRAAGVPVFVKQDTGLRPGTQGRIPDAYWLKEFPTA